MFLKVYGIVHCNELMIASLSTDLDSARDYKSASWWLDCAKPDTKVVKLTLVITEVESK